MGTVKIPDVTDSEVIFGTTRDLPAWEDIPDEFIDGQTTWNELFNQLFFNGGAGIVFLPKEGVEMPKFIRWMRAHAGSMEPKHEHKEAGIAFRLSQWFEKWDKNED